MEFIFLILLVLLYFLPAIVGVWRQKRNATAIFVLNLLAGWTVIGWIVAMVWSVAYESPDYDEVEIREVPRARRVPRRTVHRRPKDPHPMRGTEKE